MFAPDRPPPSVLPVKPENILVEELPIETSRLYQKVGCVVFDALVWFAGELL